MSDKTTAHSEAVAWQRRDLSQPHPQLGIQQWSHWRAIGANEFETLRDYKIANPSRKDIEVRELYPAPTHAAEIWHNALRFKALIAMRDRWATDEREFLNRFGQHLPTSLACLIEQFDGIMRGGE